MRRWSSPLLRSDRGGGAFLRIRRDRYAGQRLLADAARAFPCRYFGLAGERELHRCRLFSRVHHDRTRRGHVAHCADLVLEARRKRRRLVDNRTIDWVLVRNRSLSIQSNNATGRHEPAAHVGGVAVPRCEACMIA